MRRPTTWCDLQRYLAGEPVEAGRHRPRIGSESTHKHFAVLATAGAFMAVLLAATAFSAWQAVRDPRGIEGQARGE